MPKNARMQNEHSTVRVLRFPTATPSAPAIETELDSDALADSIRKAWTQKSPAKNQSGPRTVLPRLADEKI